MYYVVRTTSTNSAHYCELYCLTGLCYGLSQLPRMIVVVVIVESNTLKKKRGV